MSPPKPPSGPPDDPYTDPLSGSDTDAFSQNLSQKVSSGDNFTPLPNQNADIGIGKPPPDASYYDYNDGGNNLPIILMGIGAVLITAMIAGLVYLAYMKGVEDGQSSMPPLILAEETPVKTPPPEDVTAGRPEEGDLNIYDVLETEENTRSGQEQAETVTPENELEPGDEISALFEDDLSAEDTSEGDGGLESLMADVMEVETQTVDSPKTDTAEVVSADVKTGDAEIADVASIEDTQSDENLIPLASPKSENKAENKVEISPEQSESVAPLVAVNNYMVQLISVRTPAEASREFTRISNKNSEIIGNREPLVKEVDLGERGKFYRVNIPGFVTLEAANAFCAELKENGQDCLVVKVAQ